MLSKENIQRIEKLKARFPNTKALTIPALWMVQEQHGWVSQEAMEYVAQLLEIPTEHVYGVVTFYTMFNKNPVGKYHIQVCTNVSCSLLGAEMISDYICNRLKIKVGETTKDKIFTVSEVECLGSCGTAPTILVNEDYYEGLTIEKVDKLLNELK